MDATGCLFVLVVLMFAVVSFFWAAGSVRKEAERAQEAAYNADQLNPDSRKQGLLGADEYAEER